MWGLDRAIFWATEASWFSSVGQGAWFGARFWTQFALFWGTFLCALASAALAMRVAARPAPGAELRTLTGVLERLEPLRRNATRLAWLVLIVGAWILARHIAGGWDVVMAARAGALSDPIWGLPLARLLVNGWWEWSLFLLGALAFAGVLRALPLLAARQPSPPLRLWCALSALGILVLLGRAALYVVSASERYWSDGVTGAELFIGWPVAIVGVVLCLLAAFWCVKRPGYQKLGIAVALALFAPHLLNILLAPLALIVPTPGAIEARNRAATLAAWRLNDAPSKPGAAGAAQAPPLATHWPIWNEEALLGVARAEIPRNSQHVIDWRRATLAPREAVVAGVPAGLESWGSPHDADAANGIEWLAFDALQNIEGRAPILRDAALPLRSFYGLEGRPLLGDATSDAGVPFEFWGWKLAWAWRLRDPLLMVEGARAQRLLVARGALESAERLAPFLRWDEPQLHNTSAGLRWELAGYAATPYYGGSAAASDGVFAGNNAVAPAAILRINPRNGQAQFGNVARGWSRNWSRIVGAPDAELDVAMPLWDEARAQIARQLGRKNVPDEAVWTWHRGRAERTSYAPELPVGIADRLTVLDGAARADWTRQSAPNSVQNGAQLQMGDAVVWPEPRAPGGFWVGRPYYAATATAGVASAGGIARSAKMWRVSLTGLAPSPVASGDDARAALVNFDLQSAPAKTANTAQKSAPGSVAETDSDLALQALQAHDAAQKAARGSQWEQWAKQAALERKLLEQLAAQAPKR